MDQINEQEDATFTVEVKDEDGIVVTPTALIWTLTDEWGSVVNDKADENAQTIAALSLVDLDPTDTIVQAAERRKQHVTRKLLVTATYNSNYGVGRKKKKEYSFEIKNLRYTQ